MTLINAAYATLFTLGDVNEKVGIYPLILLYLCSLTNIYTMLDMLG